MVHYVSWFSHVPDAGTSVLSIKSAISEWPLDAYTILRINSQTEGKFHISEKYSLTD